MADISPINFPSEPEAFDIDAQPEVRDSDGLDDTFTNDGDSGVWIKNTTGGPITVTLVAAKPCKFVEYHDAAVPVADGFEGFIAMKLLPARRYNDSSNAKVTVTYSASGLRIALVRMPGD